MGQRIRTGLCDWLNQHIVVVSKLLIIITIFLIVIPAILLIGLLPGIVRHTESEIPVYPGFKDIKNTKTKVIFIGDTQRTSYWEFWRERNYNKSPVLLRKIADRDPAFLIILGDLIFQGSSTLHWTHFDKNSRPILENRLPLFPIPGNHEYYGPDEKAFKHYFSRFPHLENKTWYGFSFKNTGFIMLNSNFDQMSPLERTNQRKWYLQELAKMELDNKIKFVIVCIHHPPYTNSTVIRPSNIVREVYASQFLRCSKTAFFLSGHTHSIEIFKKNGKTFIISGGGGGHRHRLDTDKKNRKYNDTFNGPSIRFLHFCQLEIHETFLEMQIVKLDKNDSFETELILTQKIDN